MKILPTEREIMRLTRISGPLLDSSNDETINLPKQENSLSSYVVIKK